MTKADSRKEFKFNKKDNPLSDMIDKASLEDGGYYLGVCRNSYIAKWIEKDNCFYYLRTKFGNTFMEKINHPEDDDGWDLFIPYEKLPDPFDKNWKYDSRTAGLLIPKTTKEEKYE